MSALLLILGFALGAIPVFQDPVLVEDNGTPIEVGNYGAPVMFDWNRDGKKDLITGQLDSGKIRFYPNVGADLAPVFNGFEFLKADGAVVTLPYG